MYFFERKYYNFDAYHWKKTSKVWSIWDAGEFWMYSLGILFYKKNALM